MADLTVNIAGVEFKNPVITASGTFGFGREYSEFYPLRETLIFLPGTIRLIGTRSRNRASNL